MGTSDQRELTVEEQTAARLDMLWWRSAMTGHPPKVAPPRVLRALLVVGGIATAIALSVALGAYSVAGALTLIGVLVAAPVVVFLITSRDDAVMATVCVGIAVIVDYYQLLPWPFSVRVPLAPAVALAVISYRFIMRSTEHPWVPLPFRWLWAILLIMAAPAIFAGVNLTQSILYYLSFMLFPPVMFMLGMLAGRDPSQVRRLLCGLSGFGAFVALHTIIEAETGIFLFQTPGAHAQLDAFSNFTLTSAGTTAARAGSFLLNPDANGMFLAVVVVLPMALVTGARSRLAKGLYCLEAGLSLIALLFTYSVAAIIAAGVGVAVLISMVNQNRFRLAALAFLGAAVAAISSVFPSQLDLLLRHGSGRNEIALRIGIWQTALRMIRENPLAGIGLGHITYLMQEDAYRVPLQNVAEPSPHNSYLELAALAGLPALAVFLAVIGAALYLACRNYRDSDRSAQPLVAGIIAVILVVTVNSLDGADSWTVASIAWMAWILLGAGSSPLLAHLLRPTSRGTSAVELVANANSGSASAEIDTPAGSGVALAQRNSAQGMHAEAGDGDEAYAQRLQHWPQVPHIIAPASAPMPVPWLRGCSFGGSLWHWLSLGRSWTEVHDGYLHRALMTQRRATTALRARLAANSLSDAGEYLTLLGQLVRSSGAYALASIASPLVSVVLAPYLAHHLSPYEYGLLAVLNSAVAFMALASQLGLGAAFFRAYNQDYSSPRDRRDVLATTFVLLGLVSTLTMFAIIIAAPTVANILLRRPQESGLVMLAAGGLLLQNLTLPGFVWLRAENRAVYSAALSIGTLVITLAANIMLVGGLHLGVAGSLIATGAGYGFVAACTVPPILLRAGVKVRPDIAANLLTFGVPHIPGALSFWVMQLSDRYLLGLFGSLRDVASYTVSYTIGWALTLVLVSPFSIAWAPTVYIIARRTDAAAVFQLVFRWYSAILLLAAFVLSLFGSLVLGILFPESYHAAAPIIPLIAASSALYGLQSILLIGANVQRKAWLVPACMAPAALINIFFNLLLIPRLGAMGAAVATLVAYAALAALSYVANQRTYPIPFEVGRFSLAAGIGAGMYLIAVATSRTLGAQWLWPIAILAIVVYCMALLGLAWKSGPFSRVRVASLRGGN